MGTKQENTELVKVIVVKPFRDKLDLTKLYKPDEVLEFKADRATDVVNRGLAKFAEEQG